MLTVEEFWRRGQTGSPNIWGSVEKDRGKKERKKNKKENDKQETTRLFKYTSIKHRDKKWHKDRKIYNEFEKNVFSIHHW